MEPSIFSFIWKHSKREQFLLLGFTLLTFPFLYISLELPKRIINDAIGARTGTVNVLGQELTQIQFLMLLCSLFLAAVLVAGLMKMRLNTMRGVLSERMLRRFRFQLISRMLRFPKRYFRTTSQGELVSMITSEAEPMGGLMGDAIAAPVFQLGQMLTIMVFLFAQSIWFGLASVALIPLQAWLIPKLQRQINLLNKDRIKEVRHLASEIGETAAGISDLRANGGWRYRLALFTDRLGRLFAIRFQIYQKKFFMKFLNNFITQLTPFIFYSAGGILVITGEITVGALVAALGAYKDLSSPWRELLAYYNQVQDMSLRWQIVTERFAPRGMIDEALFDGIPSRVPHLRDGITMNGVSVCDHDGNVVLRDITLDIPAGARVAIQSRNATERQAFAELLVREILPSRGKIILSGHDIADLHQEIIALRIGYAHSRPYLFDGTLGDNLLMPLRIRPVGAGGHPKDDAEWLAEAKRTGNSTDILDAEWTDPSLAGFGTLRELRAWWYQLVEAMGIDDVIFRRTIRSRFDPKKHPDLAAKIIALRPEIRTRLEARGLGDVVYRFDPDLFNPAVPLGGNLLFASPAQATPTEALAREKRLVRMLQEQGLDDEAVDIALVVADTLRKTFGHDGTDHPLFRQLGLSEDTYHDLLRIAEKYQSHGKDSLNEKERGILMIIPLLLTAEQIGPGFPDAYKQKILDIRRRQSKRLQSQFKDLFTPIAPDTYVPRLTVLENAIYGRFSMTAGRKEHEVEDTVAAVLDEHGFKSEVAELMLDLPTGLGGANLPTVLQERASFTRAGIKRPDILILDKALASHDSQNRLEMRNRLRTLLPHTTMIFMEDHFEHPERYDLFVEIEHGRIDGVTQFGLGAPEAKGGDDLQRKLQVIGSAPLFSGLDDKNKRLLAFSAHWFETEPGQVIFSVNDEPDAVFLCVSGEAALCWPDSPPDAPPVQTVQPGRVIGDLSIITGQPRQLSLVSTTAATFLRIGADEFRAVIEHDTSVALQLLEAVANHLAGAARVFRLAGIDTTRLTGPAEKLVSLDTMAAELDG